MGTFYHFSWAEACCLGELFVADALESASVYVYKTEQKKAPVCFLERIVSLRVIRNPRKSGFPFSIPGCCCMCAALSIDKIYPACCAHWEETRTWFDGPAARFLRADGCFISIEELRAQASLRARTLCIPSHLETFIPFLRLSASTIEWKNTDSDVKRC